MKRRIIGFIVLLALLSSARGQTSYSYRYWYDDDLSTLQEGSANGETTIELDIGTLAKGSIHALHLQGLDARNKWGTVRTQYFFLSKERDTQGVTARYWYDYEETTAHTVPAANGLIELDISCLDNGAHVIHYHMFNAAGEASPVRTAYFFLWKCDRESTTARYWFDNDEKTAQVAPTLNGLINLDISHMEIGIHAVHYQTFNASGEASPVQTAYFYMNELQHALLSCQIWIDDKEDEAQTFPLTDDDIVIEAEDLSIGMHDLHVILLDNKGQWLAERTAAFEVKAPTVSITLSSPLETFSCEKDLDFSDVSGLKAYTAAGFHRLSGNVWMMRVDDVPAGEGLLLTGEPGTYEVPVLQSHSFYANLLVGTPEATVIAQTADGYDNYLLSTRDDEPGFFLADEDSTLAAGKAYLRIPSRETAGARRLKISFIDEPTDIKVLIDSNEHKDAIYNIAGQRIPAPQRGVSIIHKGDGTTKKVVFK